MNRILRILKLFKRMAAIVLIFSLSLSAVQTMFGTTAQAAQRKITLNRTQATLTTGTTLQLKLKNLPKAKKVQWTSSNRKVAIVSGKGKVTAKKIGIARITAKVGKKEYVCSVKVKGKPIIPSTPSESSLNASEVAALKKLIAEQRMLGSAMCENVTDDDYYTWNSDGSLEILAVNLRGAVSLQDFPALVSLYTGILDGESHDDESEKGLLTALDVTNNPALEILVCCDNRLTELDVTKNPALKVLNCYGNKLTVLDVTNNPALTLLSCAKNQFTELDVTKNVALDSLYCYGNQLTELDVTKNPALTELHCGGNKIKTLNLKNNLLLREFSCDNTVEIIK